MSGTTLLYIEDDPEQRRALATSLRERGFEVDPAGSGEDGLRLLDAERHDIVVCDLNMPGMDGLSVLTKVQARHPDMPFVLLTAHPSIPLAVKAITEGAQRFLIKPVSLDEMEKLAIRQALEQAGNNQVRAAKLLGISRDTLRYRMKKYDLLEEARG